MVILSRQLELITNQHREQSSSFHKTRDLDAVSAAIFPVLVHRSPSPYMFYSLHTISVPK